jgi:putative colanic acid biosynthesis UDP-glucose lipid carrier transferase
MILGAQSVSIVRGRVNLLGAVRASLDPILILACLGVSCSLTGAGFGGPELVLSVIAFSLTFPSEVSLQRLRQNLLGNILANWALLVLLLGFFGYATRFLREFDERMLLAWVGMTPVVLYGAHRAIPYLVPQLLAIDGYRSAVVVSANEVGRRLAQNFLRHPELGFRFLGFFDCGTSDFRGGDASNGALPGPLLGEIDAVAQHVREHRIEAVFIALPMQLQPQLLALLDELKDTTASVYFVPDIFITDLINARIDEINGMPVMAVCESPIVGVHALAKRAFDLVVAGAAVLALLPVLAAITVGVKASSPGPVIFRQRRHGLDGRQIVVWKFRSMRVIEDGAALAQARRDDPRVTRLGAFLRRTSLDELPQLFNVLKGEMSLVGPRPHAVAHNEEYRRLIKGYMVRHKVKPGITGWAQVNGLRGETDSIDKMQRRIEHDIEYLRRWSIGFDLLILVRTALIVLRRTNAY